jgi:hypothetical protein
MTAGCRFHLKMICVVIVPSVGEFVSCVFRVSWNYAVVGYRRKFPA